MIWVNQHFTMSWGSFAHHLYVFRSEDVPERLCSPRGVEGKVQTCGVRDLSMWVVAVPCNVNLPCSSCWWGYSPQDSVCHLAPARAPRCDAAVVVGTCRHCLSRPADVAVSCFYSDDFGTRSSLGLRWVSEHSLGVRVQVLTDSVAAWSVAPVRVPGPRTKWA